MLLALYIIQSTFKLISSNAFHQPALNSFFEQVIKPNLQSTVATLRCEAVKGLVLLGIMNRVSLPLSFTTQEISLQYASLLLCMVLEEDELPEVQCVAMNGLTDILITHGELRLSESQESGLGISIDEFVQGLNLYIFHSNEALQNVACECYCKLFIFDKIRSILCLSNLLLLFVFDSSFIEGFSTRQRIDLSSIKSSPCSFPPSAVPKSTGTASFLKRPWSLL